MTTLEKALADGLSQNLLLPIPDAYGNTQPSPVMRFVEKWLLDNRVSIANDIAKVLSKEKIAALVSANIEKLFESVWSGRGYYESNTEMDILKKEIRSRLVQLMAERELAKIEEQAI